MPLRRQHEEISQVAGVGAQKEQVLCSFAEEEALLGVLQYPCAEIT